LGIGPHSSLYCCAAADKISTDIIARTLRGPWEIAEPVVFVLQDSLYKDDVNSDVADSSSDVEVSYYMLSTLTSVSSLQGRLSLSASDRPPCALRRLFAVDGPAATVRFARASYR